MDFDEYDYLEKTVENPDPPKSKEKHNGAEETGAYEDKEQKQSSKHRNEEHDHRSKRSKSGDESREHDKERGSSRRRSSPRDEYRSDKDRRRSTREHRDRDKDNDKSRDDRNGKDRDRDRGLDKERDRGRERREHGREYEKERGREREKEQEQPRRSGSRSGRIRDERDREKSLEQEFKERERERDIARENRETDRGSRRYKEKKEEAVEAEVDPERDQRTVFAYQISLKADERDVYEFFSRAGKVRDVRLIMDRISRRSKGVGYIEFYDAMSVPMAIALSGQLLLNQPVMVKPSEAEKNLVQSTSTVGGVAGGSTGSYSGGARRLYVGNLHYNIKEDQLRQVFEPFGAVELVQLPTDDTGNCKGYGFIQFARLEDARAAVSLNGQLEIAGRAMKVSSITDQAGMQEIGINPGDLDDDEGGGLSLNAHSRALLMQKLDRSGTTTSVVGSLGIPTINSPGLMPPTAPIVGSAPGVSPFAPLIQAPIPALASLPAAALSVPPVTIPSVESIGIPSECLQLKNMFDPELEEEPDFDLDIRDDVQSECSKYGELKHIYVEKNSAGFVYLRFQDAQSAIAAQRALHGRWFAGKMITATFMLPQDYEAKFPESR